MKTSKQTTTCQSVVNGELTLWLAEQLELGATRLHLRHHGGDGYDTMVSELAVKENADAASLSSSIDQKIAADVRHLRDSSTYIVHAYRGSDTIGRTFIEACTAESRQTHKDDSAVLVVGQTLKHNEVLMQVNSGHTLELMEHYKEQLKMCQKAQSHADGRYWQVLELVESLVTMHHQREMDREKQAQEAQRNVYLREKLDMYLPVLMSKFFPAAAKGEVLGGELVRQFLKSLNEQQIDMIASALSPDQAAVMGQLYTTYAERELAKEPPPAQQQTNSNNPKKTNGAAHSAV